MNITSLHLHLDEYPLDWASRSILADLYEDDGNMKLANYYRWTAIHGKSPEPHSLSNKRMHSMYSSWKLTGNWFWWNTFVSNTDYPFAQIDHKVFTKIFLRFPVFKTRQEAEGVLRELLEENGYCCGNTPLPGGLNAIRHSNGITVPPI